MGLFPPLGHPSLDFVHSYSTANDARHPQTTLRGNQSATRGRLNISVVSDLDAAMELLLRWKGRTQQQSYKKHHLLPCSLNYESRPWQNEVF